MILCDRCSHSNPDGALLCESCGAALDPLAGLEGLLPTHPAAEPDLAAARGEPRAISDAERWGATLLQRIAAQPAPLGRARRQRGPAHSEAMPAGFGRLLYALVLLAALTPLVSGDLSQRWVSPRPQVVLLAEAVARIPAGGRVLAAFDYTPSYSGELDPLAETVLTDLARRGVTLVALSTRPEGIGLARRVLGRIASATPGLSYGTHYAILGFLPGEDHGLRLLTQDLNHLPRDDVFQQPLATLAALEGVRDLGDWEAILLITDDATSARRWIEQVATQTDTPTFALATARVEPLLAPYLHSGQLEALVGGAYGALEYPLAHAPQRGRLSGADGQLALWVVFVFTAVLARLSQRRGKRAGTRSM